MKNAKPTMATTASATISPELNQSSSLPLSSISCIAATQTTSSTSPMRSSGMRRGGTWRSRNSCQTTAIAPRPSGTLM